MTGIQIDVETLADAAQRIPNYAPWTTTLGEALEFWSGWANVGENDILSMRKTLGMHDFERSMTIEEARKHAKSRSH
jgi:hypothetical protein